MKETNTEMEDTEMEDTNEKDDFEMDLSEFRDRFEKYTSDTLKGVDGSLIRASHPSFDWLGNKLGINMKISGCDDKDFHDVMGSFLTYFPGGYDSRPYFERSYMSKFGPSWRIVAKDETTKYLDIRLLRPFNELEIKFEIEEKATAKDLDFLKNMWKGLYSSEKLNPEEKLKTLGVDIVDDKLPWDVLGGYEDVKEKIKKTIILPVEHSDVYKKITEQTRVYQKDITPKAVLFYGPPGTGKTTMGKIIAGKLNMPFINIPVETIFTKWYGESPRRLADIFRLAGTYERCVLFIDEIDALAIDRGNMHEESRKVLSTLLTRLDGLKTRPGILTIGATNRYEDMDPAVKRRFDDEIFFRLPNESDRKSIIRLYAKHLKDDEIAELAARTENYSGSDIEKMAKDVERAYAKKIIEEGAEGLPSIELYLTYIEERRKFL